MAPGAAAVHAPVVAQGAEAVAVAAAVKVAGVFVAAVVVVVDGSEELVVDSVACLRVGRYC